VKSAATTGLSSSIIRTVLFDLDGTLLDTAPDLCYALNILRDENGLPPLSLEFVRPAASHGGIAIVRKGFDLDPEAAEFEPLRKRFLEIYQDNLARETNLFDGMQDLLESIESSDMKWGVVTNKPSWLTEPLLDALDLTPRAACIVSGDSIPMKKPHPAPLIHACMLSESLIGECLYVGDAERDIQAGKNAGMRTVIALFGYIDENDHPETWGADHMVSSPAEILHWINTL